MSRDALSGITQVYFHRFGFKAALLDTPPSPETRLIIVIPCYDEPDLLTTLRSLADCQKPQYPVELLLVINAGVGADQQVVQHNLETCRQVRQWLAAHASLPFVCYVLYTDDLPQKHAGVGLARKVGMDEALRRFAAIDYPGLIVCLDADCTVAENYLMAVEEGFLTQLPHVCNIYFEHDTGHHDHEALRQGIIHYELFLRYYVNALRYSGFPFAMHTIGSSMAVRADVYARVGGMNRRKAGEDFYFLHKVAPHGDFININNTTVYPSSRISHRVPFGTGKAQADWLNDKSKLLETYHFHIFEDLKLFLDSTDTFYAIDAGQLSSVLFSMPASIQAFLRQQDFEDRLKEIQRNTANIQSFRKRFFNWFDGFRVLKYVHFARDHFYPPMDLPEAASRLVKQHTGEPFKGDMEALLKIFRKTDRQISRLMG